MKTKSQKVLGANSYFCRSYRGKTGRERKCFLALPILDRVKFLILAYFKFFSGISPKMYLLQHFQGNKSAEVLYVCMLYRIKSLLWLVSVVFSGINNPAAPYFKISNDINLQPYLSIAFSMRKIHICTLLLNTILNCTLFQPFSCNKLSVKLYFSFFN